jgi:4-carboxymuconolactone decarboxylase
MRVFRNVSLLVLLLGTVAVSAYAQQQQTPPAAPQPSRAQQLMGDIAPKLAELTDDVLYADIWERPNSRSGIEA